MKILIFAIMCLLFLSANLSHSASLGDIRLSLVEGDVTVRQDDSSDWIPGTSNMPVMEGASLWIPEGAKAEIQLGDGSCLRLNEKSSLQILKVEKDSYWFYLKSGNAYVNFRRVNTALQLDNPMNSVARAYDPSLFEKDVSGEGLIKISVFKNLIDVENESGKTTVKEGESLSFGGDKEAQLSPLSPLGEWEFWNVERDAKLNSVAEGSRHLPEEIRGYSNDLGGNGQWMFVKEYGHVWKPTVTDSAEWAPYRDGRWTWVGDDYVWVSYEPWGWVPYHFGRWAFNDSTGWFWVPPARGDVFWGPGYVGWVQTPEYVAWVPLAPRETYYGHGFYGRYSVDIRHADASKINVSTVYRNAHVGNSVTIIDNETFIHGHPVGQPRFMHHNVRDNPFLTHRINVGRPLIRPERSTFMPIIKDIPESRLPPQHIKDMQTGKLREGRQFVRERSVSVLRPGSPVKEMPVNRTASLTGTKGERGGVPKSTGRPGTGPTGGEGTKIGRDRKQGGMTQRGARPEVRKPMIPGPSGGPGRVIGAPRPGGAKPGVGGSKAGTSKGSSGAGPSGSKGR